MKIIEATKERLILQPSRKGDETFGIRPAFIFDLGLVPDKPAPKRLVIQRKSGSRMLLWSMTWRRFLRQNAIGSVVILDKSKMSYTSQRTAARHA